MEIILEEDLEARMVTITHQKETIQWIEDAKLENTRQGRMVKMIEMLKNASKR